MPNNDVPTSSSETKKSKKAYAEIKEFQMSTLSTYFRVFFTDILLVKEVALYVLRNEENNYCRRGVELR